MFWIVFGRRFIRIFRLLRLIANDVESLEYCHQDGLLFLKNLNTISVYTVWHSEMDRFAS